MRRISTSLVLSASLSLFACGGDGGPDDFPGADAGVSVGCEGVTAQVTADQLFTAVIDARCRSCHNSTAAEASSGGLHLGSPDELRAAAGKVSKYAQTLKVVDPGHSENSTLYLKVLGGSPQYAGPQGESVGGQMPQGGSGLTAAQQEQVRAWICGGAQ